MKDYRKILMTLPARAVTTIDFNGANPNYYRVANSGNATIYAGLQHMPTNKLYEFKIEANQTRMYAEDRGYPKLYLYNSSGSPVDVIIYSFSAQFDPSVLAFCDFNIAENQQQTVQVEIDGFTESLPAGSNNIGKVDINSLPSSWGTKIDEVISAIGDIPGGGGGGGTSSWTSTNITNLLSYVDGLETLIGTTNTNINTTNTNIGTTNTNLSTLITNINKLTYEKYTAPTSTNVNNSNASASYTTKIIKLLTNDGANDLKITYSSNTFVLKAGESITDFAIGETAGGFTIAPNVSGENISYRLLMI